MTLEDLQVKFVWPPILAVGPVQNPLLAIW